MADETRRSFVKKDRRRWGVGRVRSHFGRCWRSLCQSGSSPACPRSLSGHSLLILETGSPVDVAGVGPERQTRRLRRN